MRGGRESAHQAQLQAEHIDPTAQLMRNDLRLLGIPASDMRVRSVEEVDEMLADIRELRREWGRRGGLESSRRADAQAAEMGVCWGCIFGSWAMPMAATTAGCFPGVMWMKCS